VVVIVLLFLCSSVFAIGLINGLTVAKLSGCVLQQSCRHICQNHHSGEARTVRSPAQWGIFHFIATVGRTNEDIKGKRSAHSLHVLTSQEPTLEPRGSLDQNGADGELANSKYAERKQQSVPALRKGRAE
jgi:hypothetical protein